MNNLSLLLVILTLLSSCGSQEKIAKKTNLKATPKSNFSIVIKTNGARIIGRVVKNWGGWSVDQTEINQYTSDTMIEVNTTAVLFDFKSDKHIDLDYYKNGVLISSHYGTTFFMERN